MIVTVVPAKPFAESKQRLAPVLAQPERIHLSRNLLAHTLQAALPLGPVEVISRSKNVCRFSVERGARAIEENIPGLNHAITQGIDWAQQQGASGVLVLPLDLPLLSTLDLEKLLAQARENLAHVIIAPCRRGQGTNALFLSPPRIISPQFGPRSFARHQQLARKAGLEPIIHHSSPIAFDLDTSADWLELTRRMPDHRWLEAETFLTGLSGKSLLHTRCEY